MPSDILPQSTLPPFHAIDFNTSSTLQYPLQRCTSSKKSRTLAAETLGTNRNNWHGGLLGLTILSLKFFVQLLNLTHISYKMFGDKALELVKELKRSMDGTLPPYNVRFLFDSWWKIFGGNLCCSGELEMLWVNLMLFLIQLLIYFQR